MAAPRQGTGFVNFGDFLNANRAGAGALTDRLSAGPGDAMRRASMGLEAGQADFGREVQAGTFDGRALALGEQPTAYTGPTDIGGNQNFAKGEEDARSAAQGAQRLSSLYGRMGALQDTYGASNPTYGAGQQAFDSALLGGVGQGRFEQGAKDAKGLLDRFGSARTAAQQQASAAQAAGASNAAAAVDRANRAYGGWGRPAYPAGFTGSYAPPYQRPAAGQPGPSGNQLGTTYAAPAQQGGTGTTVGTTQAQPSQPPKKGGRYVGSQWVSYT